MTDKELIKKIKQLEQIQPSAEWLGLTRQKLISGVILSDDPQEQVLKSKFGFFNRLRGLELQPVALALCLLLIFMGGPWLLVEAAQYSLPGEALYSVKKISEQFQARVASDKTKAQLQVEFAGRRLEELTKISEDSFSPEEKDEKVREVVDNLKDNLAGASVYAAKIDKEKAMAVAEKTEKIKEGLNKTREEASAELENDLDEAEKAIEEINNQVLTVLTGQGQETTEGTATTTPVEETIIILEELESDDITTTTEEVVSQVEK